MKKIKGQKLWAKAKKIIPGGNMFFSKRAEYFLPNYWPTYFSKAKGCKIWDLEKNVYTDMSLMGVGTNILGYGHPEVDSAVKKAIKNGNLSSFNCPEEVELAEKLIELHKWSSKAKFARTGGEANAVAVRIARAATGKSGIAICGYHGWHDWYLAASLKKKHNLDNHLMKGLNPIGVPKELINTIFPFQYNNLNEFKKIVEENKNIGIIKMEVSRNFPPQKNFLSEIRKIASKKNIVLIFDECSSGFRECYGGLHKKFKINPDIAIFGKALGNGYAVTAIIGREEIMEHANQSFISSSFWSERIGSCAALKTLEVMKRVKSWDYITKTGKKIKERWQKLAKKYNLKIEIQGLSSMANFNFKSKNNMIYKTYITQEMLKKGFLASNTIYVSTAHSQTLIDRYFYELDKIFKKISKFENDMPTSNLLDGPVCQTGFYRFN